MTGLLSLVIYPIVSAGAAVLQATEELAEPETIGIIVMSVIIGPVIVLIIAGTIGGPKKFRIPGLFVGSVILLIGAFVVLFAAVGFLLSFIVPQ